MSEAFVPLPAHFRRALLTEQTSRINKLHLAISWKQLRGWYVEWRWAGEGPELPYGVMRSRLCFQFEPDGPFIEAKSFDEDVVPTLKYGKEQK